MIGAFVPARVVEARIARGLTGPGLADVLNVHPSAVSQWETGRTVPREETLRLIAEKLNLREWFFRRPVNPRSEQPIFWRSFAYATKTARGRCETRFQWLKEITGYLHSQLEFPAVNVPVFSTSDEVVAFSSAQIEQFAGELRAAWGLGDGPIGDAVLALENNGIVVARSSLGTEALDAFCQWGNLEPYPIVVLGTDKTGARSRLDAFHELAHLMLHRRLTSKVFGNSAMKHMIESQAFDLAGAILLPEKQFLSELWAPTLDAFRALKERWKVSIGAMLQRARVLGIVTDEQHKRLWMAYARRGWKSREPLDEFVTIEHPRLLRRSFTALFEHRLKTPAQILLDLPFSSVDIESLCGLPEGFLSDPPEPSILPRAADQRSAGSVVRFTRPK